MLAHFARGSSEVDWCETNYVHVTFIAEFYNTVSNVIFLVLPPFLIYLFRPYSKHVCPRVNILWVLMVIIGLSSAYFHATLSLVGQLMDEIAILWVLMAAFALFTPSWMLALGPFGNNRKIFQYSILAASLICTWLGFLYPVANAFVLMLIGAPFVIMLFAELKSCRDVKVIKLGFVCAGWLVVAVAFWVNDKVFCEISRSVSFPYLHCVWHILIFIASYTGCVLGAYFYAASEFPELGPTLSYWPPWSCDWGVPYIALRSTPNQLSP